MTMTREEKECIERILDKSDSLRDKERAIKRLGEILEETFILDLLPSRQLKKALGEIAASRSIAPALKQKVKSLIKKYRL
ncbi:MAG: hypothetical protein AB3N63_13210 [Puniceicoccaceae bacterium]